MSNLIFIITLGFSIPLYANSVSIPWEEFKQLYDAQLKSTLQIDRKAPYYTIDTTHYNLTIGKQAAQGSIKITGQWLQGDIQPIPLFSNQTTITQVIKIDNGQLIQREGKIWVLPKTNQAFTISLKTIYPVKQDEQSLYIDFHPAIGIQNQLTLNTRDGLSLLDQPGIAQNQQQSFFQHNHAKKIRLQTEQSKQQQGRYELVTELRIENDQPIARTWLKPLSHLNTMITIVLPDESQWLTSSLPSHKIDHVGSKNVQLKSNNDVFWVDYLLADSLNKGIKFQPLQIKHQRFSVHKFVLSPSKQGELRLRQNEQITTMPSQYLENEWLQRLPVTQSFYQLAQDHTVHLIFEKYQTLDSPPTVLEKIEYFSSIDESGKTLSTLRLSLPAFFGQHFVFTPPEKAKIWSLKVNGNNENVYLLPSGQWAIPLATKYSSLVEISYLEQSKKLGLQGRLPIVVPAIGLASKQIFFTLALPARVQLQQVEGNLQAVGQTTTSIPDSVIGHPYFFQQALYQGEGFHLAFHYQEPVE